MSTTPIITFSQSNEGKRVIICDGFVYQLNKLCLKVKYWCCEKRLDVLCRHFSNNEIDLNEYLEGLSMVVAKDMNKKKMN